MAEQAVGTDLHLPAASESPALQPPALQQPQMGGTLPLPSAGGFLRRWICFSSQGTCLWSRGWCRGRWRQAQPRQRCNASLQRELLPCLALSGCLNLWSSSSSFMILCAFPCSLITAAYYFTGPQSTARIPVLGLAWGSCLALQYLTRRFQRQGVWGGGSAQAPWALLCGDSAGSAAGSCQAPGHQMWSDWYEPIWDGNG